MDKQQKQIEEMANDVRSYYHGSEYDELADDISFSEHLVNLGWIKLDGNAVVLTEKEYGELYQRMFDEVRQANDLKVEQARKESAEKMLNDISSDILVINTKEYGNIEVIPVERLQEICGKIVEGK